MTTMEQLRQRVDREIFDYRQLTDSLREYAKPRDKIGALLAAGSLVRVKKGLYVFGEPWRRQPVCRELLANLIYGPSYISMEYALSLHGLIPERVTTLTSVTSGRTRRFQTPFGLFTYRPVPTIPYSLGIAQDQSGPDPFLVASPEKALADFVWADRGFHPSGPAAFDAYLHDNLRMEPDRLAALNPKSMQTIAAGYNTPRITMLAAYLQDARRRSRR
ncbi:MAG: hypothetical protein R6X19_00790 [Kiritimatiellia bacterium]